MTVTMVKDENYLKSRLNNLAELSPEAAHLYRKFERSKKGENVKLGTRINYLKVFTNFIEFLTNIQNKDILEISMDDLESYKFVMREEDSGFYKKVSTQKSYLIQIRIILRWMMDQEFIATIDYRKFEKFKLPKLDTFTPVEPEDLVAEEELRAILRAAGHPRNRAIISLVAKNGLAIKEALWIKKKDITVYQTHIEIKIHDKRATKTKYRKRRVVVVVAQKYLLEWINRHSFWDTEENPFLFVSLVDSPRWLPGHQLSYDGAYDMLERTCQKAGTRRINWHLLRHGAATEDALDDMHPELMNKKYGWAPGSKMPQVYVNVADQRYIEYEKRRKGISSEEELEELEQTQLLMPRICPRCEKENPFEARLCSFCGSAFDEKVVKEEVGDLQDVLEFIEQNKEFIEMIPEMAKTMKLLRSVPPSDD